jgi:hypothetical protein
MLIIMVSVSDLRISGQFMASEFRKSIVAAVFHDEEELSFLMCDVVSTIIVVVTAPEAANLATRIFGAERTLEPVLDYRCCLHLCLCLLFNYLLHPFSILTEILPVFVLR